MLEYFTIKKIRKHQAAKKAKEEEAAAAGELDDAGQEGPAADQTAKKHDSDSGSDEPPPLPMRPVLDRSDESFLESILSDDSPAAPQQGEVAVADLEWPSDVSSQESGDEEAKAKKKKDKGKEKEKPGRLSHLFHKNKKHGDTLTADDATAPGDEAKREERDINRLLDRMNLSAYNNKVVSMSDDTAEVLRRFTQVFKDLANGVPTAYDDLVRLVSDRDGTINRGFEKLPSSMQKLVTQLPEKLTSTIAPELLAAAAASQGIDAKAEGGIKGTAQKLFMPKNILELATKPGALVGMLRAIVTALKTRWPAFLGVNVLWSISLLCEFSLATCHAFVSGRCLVNHVAYSAHVRPLVLS